jgi:hypothetical protein
MGYTFQLWRPKYETGCGAVSQRPDIRSVQHFGAWLTKEPIKHSGNIQFVMAGFFPAIHVFTASQREGRGWPGIGERSDAVLRTAMPGHDRVENVRLRK